MRRFLSGSLLLIIFTSTAFAQQARWVEPKTTIASISEGQYDSKIILKVIESEVSNAADYEIYTDTRTYGQLKDFLKGFDYNIMPLFTAPKSELLNRKKIGERNTGKQLANLSLYYAIELMNGSTTEKIALANNILNMGMIETVYFAPRFIVNTEKAELLSSADKTTPDFTYKQTYLDPAPGGVDAKYAWTFKGGKGDGVTFCDIEYAWLLTHEDLVDKTVEVLYPTSSSPQFQHGTSVAGVVFATHNGFGIDGIAPDVSAKVSSQCSNSGCTGFNVANAIDRAVPKLNAGDVLLLEAQTYDMMPVEDWSAEYSSIETASALGIVVVEAAGNGSKNLDNYSDFDPTKRHSGAFIVGSVNCTDQNLNPTSPAGGKRASSCYGKRIDLNAWGEKVTCTGAGSSSTGNLQHTSGTYTEDYTSNFNGTSSASAIVAGSICALQGIHLDKTGAKMTLTQLDVLLKATGTAPTDGNTKVGVMPNLKGAIDQMIASGIQNDFVHAANFNIYPNPTQSSTQIQFDLKQGSNVEISIYDVIGNKLEVVKNGNLPEGNYQYEWSAEHYAKGIYFIQLNVADNVMNKRVVLMR